MRARIATTTAAMIVAAAAHAAPMRTILYSFGPSVFPSGNLATDEAGNIYGTGEGGDGDGLVFEVSPPASGQGSWTETSLHYFSNFPDGLNPSAGVIRDKAGNLYGTATYGGAGAGCGTVFELQKTSSGWNPKTLWVFAGDPTDGCRPIGSLNMDDKGTLYGTTSGGGATDNGTVFRLVPPKAGASAWTESLLWSFDGKSDGSFPASQMTFDPAGNLYGTTARGGPHSAGFVWELTPPSLEHTLWTRTVIFGFSVKVCTTPGGSLARDNAGDLFGSCYAGGPANSGAVFELSPHAGAWSFNRVWAIGKGVYVHPTSGVVISSAGDLFGVTGPANGTLFILHPPASGKTGWTPHTLWNFDGQNGLYDPQSPVLLGRRGAVFGTTSGPQGNGTVWQLQP